MRQLAPTFAGIALSKDGSAACLLAGFGPGVALVATPGSRIWAEAPTTGLPRRPPRTHFCASAHLRTCSAWLRRGPRQPLSALAYPFLAPAKHKAGTGVPISAWPWRIAAYLFLRGPPASLRTRFYVAWAGGRSSHWLPSRTHSYAGQDVTPPHWHKARIGVPISARPGRIGLSLPASGGVPISAWPSRPFLRSLGGGQSSRRQSVRTRLSVSLQAVTFDLSCCHPPGDLNEHLLALTAGAATHMMFEGHGGRTGLFAPFIWHNIAIDPFNLSPSAQPSTRLPRWVAFTRFLTP